MANSQVDSFGRQMGQGTAHTDDGKGADATGVATCKAYVASPQAQGENRHE